MKFLPTENITYKTKLKEEEIIRRLSEVTEPEKTFSSGGFSSGSTKPYEGRINDHTFDIRRITNYRNSFLPSINGTIESDFDGITIKVKIRLPIFVIGFLWFWCGLVGLGFIVFLIQDLVSQEFNPATLIPFGMLIFVYLMTTRAFKSESSKSKKDLQTIFEADIIET